MNIFLSFLIFLSLVALMVVLVVWVNRADNRARRTLHASGEDHAMPDPVRASVERG